jgi:hypothetical protein
VAALARDTTGPDGVHIDLVATLGASRRTFDGLDRLTQETPIGGALASLENAFGIQFPSFVWALLSATFALNASGTATAVILGVGGGTYASVELPLLMARGIPVVVMP